MTQSEPLVSIVIPTRNSAQNIDSCLKSIKKQSYKNIEVVVVDQSSKDKTVQIAESKGAKVINLPPPKFYSPPSRSRNVGVKNSKGQIIYHLDSDMELASKLIEEVVSNFKDNPSIGALIVHEVDMVDGFWSKCKALERKCYWGNDNIESARVVRKELFELVGGYDESINTGEDFDIHRRYKEQSLVGFCENTVHHNLQSLRLKDMVYKKFYYGKTAAAYFDNKNVSGFFIFKEELKSYLKNYQYFFTHPLIGSGTIVLKLLELVAGTTGLIFPKNNSSQIYSIKSQNKKKTPYTSFLIPTYNAEKYLSQCLESIFTQDYPSHLYEVIVADGGSNDNTFKILSNYNVKVVQNPKRIAEFGKLIAFQHSKGELIILLDSDNIIASPVWLNNQVRIMDQHPDITCAESNYLVAPGFSSLNEYISLLVIADPLARILSPQPTEIKTLENFKVKLFKKGSCPVAGANGFMWRRTTIESSIGSNSELNEISIMRVVSSKEEIKIANLPGNGIYHFYSNSLYDYCKKRHKIATKYLVRSQNGSTWVSSRPKLLFVLSVLYLGTFIGPAIEGIFNMIRMRNKNWLWHPLISFITIWLYIYVFLEKYFRGMKRS